MMKKRPFAKKKLVWLDNLLCYIKPMDKMVGDVGENILDLYRSDSTKPMRVNNVHRGKKESTEPNESIIRDLRNLCMVKKWNEAINDRIINNAKHIFE